jgi:hypothetical protein
MDAIPNDTIDVMTWSRTGNTCRGSLIKKARPFLLPGIGRANTYHQITQEQLYLCYRKMRVLSMGLRSGLEVSPRFWKKTVALITSQNGNPPNALAKNGGVSLSNVNVLFQEEGLSLQIALRSSMGLLES